MQCVQWLLEETSAADEMSNNVSRSALIHLTIKSGQDECLKCLLAYIRDKYLELGKSSVCTLVFQSEPFIDSLRAILAAVLF